MSNMMCDYCGKVTRYSLVVNMICPECDNNDWADPLDDNDEWETIRRLQIKVEKLEANNRATVRDLLKEKDKTIKLEARNKKIEQQLKLQQTKEN